MAELVVLNGVGFKRRNPWGVFALTIVTLGIYYVVWWYKINNEMRNAGTSNDPLVATLAVTLGGILVIPPIVSAYKTADRIKQTQERQQATDRMAPVLALVMLFVVGPFALPYYQSQLNKAWDAMTVVGGAEVRPV